MKKKKAAKSKKTDPEMETMVKSFEAIFEIARSGQEIMMSGFPTLWDAYWYGSASSVVEQAVSEMGEKKAGEIVGEDALAEFLDDHESVIQGMYEAVHRPEVDSDDIAEFEEATESGDVDAAVEKIMRLMAKL